MKTQTTIIGPDGLEFNSEEALDTYLENKRKQTTLEFPQHQKAIEEFHQAIQQVNEELNESDRISSKWRDAGFKPSDAHEILTYAKTCNMGQIFNYKDKLYVRTPFNTVVEAQVYINTIQKRLMELSSVTIEKQLDRLTQRFMESEQRLDEFNNLKFLDLLKLTLKKLF